MMVFGSLVKKREGFREKVVANTHASTVKEAILWSDDDLSIPDCELGLSTFSLLATGLEQY